jgi:hypothetical protein
MAVFFVRLFLITGLVYPGYIPAGMTRPVSADWCQCVIFVLNLMGIEQIPGEYWTAASLAVPDETGKTWMEYQGFSKRPAEGLPQPGDLLVLAGGTEVVVPQIWNGIEHLVPVPVDVWAGHIGIVENAHNVEKEGRYYKQITLLSANWGVNAKPAGVIGSCYNVDESVFLLPGGYDKAQFFFASNPLKMRERVVNRAKRWSLLGLASNPQTTMDGYPLTPSGFVSASIMEPGEQPLKSVLVESGTDLIEIFGAAALPGDILSFRSNNGQIGYGILTGNVKSMNSSREMIFQVISMRPGGRVIGPETWNLNFRDDIWGRVFPDNTFSTVRFYRFKKMPGYPMFGADGDTWMQEIPRRVSVKFLLTNAGGSEIEITNLYIQAQSQNSTKNQPVLKFPEEKKITLQAGEIYTYSTSSLFPTAGKYELEVHYEWQNKSVVVEKAAVINVE